MVWEDKELPEELEKRLLEHKKLKELAKSFKDVIHIDSEIIDKKSDSDTAKEELYNLIGEGYKAVLEGRVRTMDEVWQRVNQGRKNVKLTGEEKFCQNGVDMGLSMLDFWRFQYSNLYNIQEYIAEFLVAKALGKNEADNAESWTLYDISYQGKRIEVKESSYYHPWNEGGKISEQRSFGITEANSSYEDDALGNKYERQNDIYVFCLNVGRTREASHPLNLDNWEFYIVSAY